MGGIWLDLGDYHGPSRFHAFVMYCVQRFRDRAHRDAYRSYIADSLQNIPQGRYVSTRWSDMIAEHKEIDVDATIDHVLATLEE